MAFRLDLYMRGPARVGGKGWPVVNFFLLSEEFFLFYVVTPREEYNTVGPPAGSYWGEAGIDSP